MACLASNGSLPALWSGPVKGHPAGVRCSVLLPSVSLPAHRASGRPDLRRAPLPCSVSSRKPGTSAVTSTDQLTRPLGRALGGGRAACEQETPPSSSPACSCHSSSGGRAWAVEQPPEPRAANVSLSQQALGGPPITTPPWDRPPQSFLSCWTPMTCLKLVLVPVRPHPLLSHMGRGSCGLSLGRGWGPLSLCGPHPPSPGWCGVFFLVMAPAQGQQDPLFARLSCPRWRRSLGSLLGLCPRPVPTKDRPADFFFLIFNVLCVFF